MAWSSANPVNNPVAGGVLVSETFTDSGRKFVVILVSTTLAFDAILQHLDTRGAIRNAQILPVNASIWASPSMGPIHHHAGEILRVIARNGFSGEANASIFLDDNP